jgi:hypothetical protein
MKAVHEGNYPKTYWGFIVRRGGELLHRRRNAEITWVGRSGNKVAHHLARWASIEPNKEWDSVVPPDCLSNPKRYEAWVIFS